MQIDTLIHAKWIAPVSDNNPILENHSIAIHDGRIIELFPSDQPHQYQATQSIHATSHLLIPGLINAHTHSSMTLLRGLADDLPLMTWLNEHIWPAEQQWVDQQFVEDGSRLAIAEMLLGGTTCFNDMYVFPDITAQVATETGIRAHIGLIVIDFPSAWAADAKEYLSKGLALHDSLTDNPLVHTCLAPHAPYSVSDEPFSEIQTLAESLNIPIHLHLHETQDEIQQGLEQYKLRPMQRLDQLNLINQRLIAVHMTQLTHDEIQRLADQNAHVVHCPESNLKLASGFCPVQSLLDKGINVALGTDGAASNNDLDMLGEMRTAALLGKGVAQDASALATQDILRMATINGAKALGIEHETGSLEVGKSADMVAINLDDLASQPIYNPLSQLIYTASRHQVEHVWVAGKQLVDHGKLTQMNEVELRQMAQGWQEKIQKNR